MKRNVALWTGILAGPVIWLIGFEANFALAPWACTLKWKPALYAISIISLAITAGSGWLSWVQWQRLGREWPGQAASTVARSQMLAIGGVLLSAMFFLVILAQAIPELMLGACE